jgi:hypothetical protein
MVSQIARGMPPLTYRQSTLDPHPLFSGNPSRYHEDGILTGRELRLIAYGNRAAGRDAFFDAKFRKTEAGDFEVRADWSYAKFIAQRIEGLARSASPDAYWAEPSRAVSAA